MTDTLDTPLSSKGGSRVGERGATSRRRRRRGGGFGGGVSPSPTGDASSLGRGLCPSPDFSLIFYPQMAHFCASAAVILGSENA